MKYTDIDKILERRGLNHDPAFEDVTVKISPIEPDEKGRTALGLYFPEDKLIVLPPSLSTEPNSLGETVTLHEFSHRHGHYYYNNLTEQYAENERQRWQGRLEYHDIFGKNDDVIQCKEAVKTMPSLIKANPCDYCHAPERLCPYCEYGGHSVKVNFDKGFAVPAIANITGTINRVEILWKNQGVTKVPKGEPFLVRVHHNALTNPGGGQWQADATVIATDGTLPNVGGSKVATYGGNTITAGWIDCKDLGNLIMPDHDVTLRIKLWAYPFYNDTPPVRSDW
ncbi:MAG: hypothetical protein V1767_00895 [Chloroflexota bacterium]